MLDLSSKTIDESVQGSALESTLNPESKKKFYIESYGCAMNFNDSEIIASILHQHGYGSTQNLEQADLILLNTCSIREKAEQTVRFRLNHFKGLKKRNRSLLVGVLGCMAERLKDKLLEEEKLVDIVIGPDAYRSLPSLIEEAEGGQKSVNVLLSREETYADISPVRLDQNGVSSFVSIMRGCNNMCSFCVVPFTRGRERSRDPYSIVREATELFEQGYREVTLLGQNVDSYRWEDEAHHTSVSFAQLLEKVALIDPLLRVRFSTSHPKDITDEVLFTIAKYENICNYIHLPLQSGSTRILQLMNRTYTKEWYLHKIDRIREIIPGCAISTDIICGFCTETEEDHQETISVMKYGVYELAYIYAYSERPGTLASRRYEDDVPAEVKSRRLSEIIDVHRENSRIRNLEELGRIHTVLVEGPAKKNADSDHCGRTDTNKMVNFAKGNSQIGDYVKVKIIDSSSGSLRGEILP
ncbi:MAG: tRNA (N6-isopentenyl adenosine(37)-C2)-methylthiotransferase MiaB [Chitinophagaceae bacterium]|nr:tRNA (N6-isopentenyl adenosine(37)-C2)-methylthiotransferase MiaB [Chitinophagaceae bacterium]